MTVTGDARLTHPPLRHGPGGRCPDLVGGVRGPGLGMAVRPGHRAHPDARGGAARHRVRSRGLPARRPRGQGGPARPATASPPSGSSSRSCSTTPTTTRCPRSTWRWTGWSPRTRRPSCSRRRPVPRGTTPVRCWTTRGWATLLDEPRPARRRGLRSRASTATLHPHVGTMVESGEETDRVLAGSGIGLCLDTGHLLIGGGDPVAVASRSPDRVAHVHLKDVAADVADRVRHDGLSYTDGVRAGMYRPLGAGRRRRRRHRHVARGRGLHRLVRPRAGHHPRRRAHGGRLAPGRRSRTSGPASSTCARSRRPSAHRPSREPHTRLAVRRAEPR